MNQCRDNLLQVPCKIILMTGRIASLSKNNYRGWCRCSKGSNLFFFSLVLYMAFITTVSETWSARIWIPFGFKGFLPVEVEGVQTKSQKYTSNLCKAMADFHGWILLLFQWWCLSPRITSFNDKESVWREGKAGTHITLQFLAFLRMFDLGTVCHTCELQSISLLSVLFLIKIHLKRGETEIITAFLKG